MHGRVFKIEHKDHQIIDLMASFGGLLLKLTGEQSQLDALTPDMKSVIIFAISCSRLNNMFDLIRFYLLMRKVE